MYISPSPFDATKGDRKLAFYKLPGYIKIRLYNMKAETVYEDEAYTDQGSYSIDLSVQRMKSRLSSGLYIYIIEDRSGNKKTGKIAVIR